jgi:hypothetical protein
MNTNNIKSLLKFVFLWQFWSKLIFKIKKEKHYCWPFFFNSLCVANSAVYTVLHSTIVFYISQGFVWIVLNSSIFFYITNSSVWAILYCPISFYVTNGRISAILYSSIMLYITYGFVWTVLNGAIQLNITGSALIAWLYFLSICTMQTKRKKKYEKIITHLFKGNQ